MGRDMTEICPQHVAILRSFLMAYKPKNIIETGTYVGLGSTIEIANYLKNSKIENSIFYSIECNRELYLKAISNSQSHGISDVVIFVNGISVPRKLLPNDHEIMEIAKKALSAEHIKTDHGEDLKKTAVLYSKETKCDEKDDWLGEIIKVMRFNPDFVLLDSAGHLGFIEFQYLLSLLAHPCAIGLDDTNHIKHYQSKEMILKDSRFNVLFMNNDYTGSLIAQFTP